MSKEFIRTPNAPQPFGPYSQAIKVGPLLFVSAQGPVDPRTRKIEPAIASQTRQILLNIESIIEASGLTLSDVIRVSVFLKNVMDFQKMNEVYQTFFPTNPPTRSTIEVNLHSRGMLIEMYAIAYRQ